MESVKKNTAQNNTEDIWRNTLHNLLPGIDPADFRVGQKLTISPNLLTGDRSFTRQVHQVVAFNTSHVQTRYIDGVKAKQLAMLLVNEHHFYAADGFEVE